MPMNQPWAREIQRLCLNFGATCTPNAGSIIIRAERTVLRLTDFQNHFFIAIGVKNAEHQDQWIGFVTLDHIELEQFLRNTLEPIP